MPHGTGTAPAQRSKHGTNCPAWWGKGVKWYFCSKIAAQALEKKKKIRAQCMAVYEEQLNPSQLHGKRQVY